METFNSQLQGVMSAALMSVASNMEKSKSEPNALFWSKEDAFDEDNDCLYDDFLQMVPEIIHTFPYEGNLTCYPLSLKGEPENEIIELIDEQGNVWNVDLFELDAHNITVVADWLNKSNS
jgi:hypothetical protein